MPERRASRTSTRKASWKNDLTLSRLKNRGRSRQRVNLRRASDRSPPQETPFRVELLRVASPVGRNGRRERLSRTASRTHEGTILRIGGLELNVPSRRRRVEPSSLIAEPSSTPSGSLRWRTSKSAPRRPLGPHQSVPRETPPREQQAPEWKRYPCRHTLDSTKV